jgi:hypothetical protein
MNAPDPLEVELSELVPRQASRDFRRRVLEELRASPPSPRQSPMLPVACGLAAACLMAILLWWRGDVRGKPGQLVTQPAAVPQVEVNESRPTVLAYRHVLAGPAHQLDAVLREQSSRTLPPDPVEARLYAFRRSDVDSFE